MRSWKSMATPHYVSVVEALIKVGLPYPSHLTRTERAKLWLWFGERLDHLASLALPEPSGLHDGGWFSLVRMVREAAVHAAVRLALHRAVTAIALGCPSSLRRARRRRRARSRYARATFCRPRLRARR